MIRSPWGLRLNPQPSRSPRDQIRQAATLGAKGVVLDATGDLAPDRLSETGRRELRHLLRSVELTLIALHLPTRRPFDTDDQLDERLARADRAFALAFELGGRLVLGRVGGVPSTEESHRREVFTRAVTELGRRADHRGVRLGIETGPDSGAVLRGFLDPLASPALAASLDPAALAGRGHDPVEATRALGPWVAHAYATEPVGAARGLDWAEYLGALEEINYRGFLTVWPDPGRDPAAEFAAMLARLRRF